MFSLDLGLGLCDVRMQLRMRSEGKSQCSEEVYGEDMGLDRVRFRVYC